ncbi:hypothetical protein [Levilinea saccharolytica]|jgi:hypothetical protein|uniref:Uncharacterized protein n=1 Tax=Levilinea saccharolytica TaxID=229921 RepID=A0A0P6YJR6_9CHLR|nr:hypothetical protein [Levilinea saccharolytica]KPL90844.1 hypothetical protein ADN01_01965 [Levilinea saccharolytica]GAP18951.1 hypothetical protein LSAC_02849 [Levilinea saccharolytica]
MNNPVDRLTDGLDETQRQALGDLNALAHFLETDLGTEPETAGRDHLLTVLEQYLPGSPAIKRRQWTNWLRLAHSQSVLFEKSFWLAGLLVLLLGLSLSVIDGRDLLPLVFIVVAPLLAAVGVAYVFRPETRTLGELERLTATGAAELLYTRLALVLAFNLLISLLLLLLIWLEGPQVVLWRLTLIWLGPMLALTGLAFYATIRWNSLVGAILPLGLWGCLILLGWSEAVARATEGMTPAFWLLLIISRSDPLLIGASLACLVGLGLLGLAGRTAPGGEKSWS